MKWLTKRKKILGIHLYRRPFALASDMFKNEKYSPSWEKWTAGLRRVCPIQYFVRNDIPTWFSMLKSRYRYRWYDFKCKYFLKYNVLKIKTLPPTWSDEDTLLVHAMFAVLGRFMENKPDETVDYEMKWTEDCGQPFTEYEKYAEPHRTFWKEVNGVWDWWQQREAREKQLADVLHICAARKTGGYSEAYKEYNELEVQFKKEEDEKLEWLIKNRGFLWI